VTSRSWALLGAAWALSACAGAGGPVNQTGAAGNGSTAGTTGTAGGGAAGASGGAASGVWCALLIGGLVLLVQQLRRYRFRLVVPAPRGVVFLLQRPG